jgi:hypothetical protein
MNFNFIWIVVTAFFVFLVIFLLVSNFYFKRKNRKILDKAKKSSDLLLTKSENRTLFSENIRAELEVAITILNATHEELLFFISKKNAEIEELYQLFNAIEKVIEEENKELTKEDYEEISADIKKFKSVHNK